MTGAGFILKQHCACPLSFKFEVYDVNGSERERQSTEDFLKALQLHLEILVPAILGVDGLDVSHILYAAIVGSFELCLVRLDPLSKLLPFVLDVSDPRFQLLPVLSA